MNKICSLSYASSYNIGDEIQTLAAINALRKINISVCGYLDRDNPVGDGECLLLINAWIDTQKVNFPFDKGLLPIFSNIHIADNDLDKCKFFTDEGLDYLRRYSPIGCRDKPTQQLLSRFGISTYYNYCLTLVFDKREAKSCDSQDAIFLVDMDKGFKLPKMYKDRNVVHISHCVDKGLSHEEKIRLANEKLDLYKSQASLVITSRLHAALPCLAMGIPVIFFGNSSDGRLSVLKEFIPIYDYFFINMRCEFKDPPGKVIFLLVFIKQYFRQIASKLNYFFYRKKINWDPDPINLDSVKADILSNLKSHIETYTKSDKE
jgi:hypothetical protein